LFPAVAGVHAVANIPAFKAPAVAGDPALVVVSALAVVLKNLRFRL
jgi:hypothetical protein